MAARNARRRRRPAGRAIRRRSGEKLGAGGPEQGAQLGRRVGRVVGDVDRAGRDLVRPVATAATISADWSASAPVGPEERLERAADLAGRGARAMTRTAGPAAGISGSSLLEAVHVPAGAGGAAASAGSAPRSTSAKTGVLVPISSISVATGVGSPGMTSLA